MRFFGITLATLAAVLLTQTAASPENCPPIDESNRPAVITDKFTTFVNDEDALDKSTRVVPGVGRSYASIFVEYQVETVSEMMCAARDTCFTFEVIDTALKNMGIRIRKWRQNIIFGLHDWCMNFEEQCQALSCEEMGVSHPTMSPIATGRRK